MTKQLYTAKEVAELCGISESSAYKIIARLNKELKDKGYLTFSGKVSRLTLVNVCMAVLLETICQNRQKAGKNGMGKYPTTGCGAESGRDCRTTEK